MLKQKKWLIGAVIVVLSFFIYSNIGDQLSSEFLLSRSTETEVTNDVYTNNIITEENNSQEKIIQENKKQESSVKVVYGNDYYSKDEVATYLHAYAELPPNYITKSEASALGWDADKGNLWEVSYGSVIGGDRFGNREGLLPKKEGRIYYECDVNYEGDYRNAMRLVFSNDGLIYYTEDHYASFEPLFP